MKQQLRYQQTLVKNDSRPRHLRHSLRTSMSQSTNNDGTALSDHLRRLSLTSAAAGTALPQSSPVAVPSPRSEASNHVFSHSPGKTPLRRAPSSSSIGGGQRSSTPTLQKRTSLSSLQGGSGATPPRSPAIRRTSSYLTSSPNAGRSSLSPAVEESQKPPMTAATVAYEFLKKDLEANHGRSEIMGDAQTVVILQDDCYGHRYSRPRTSKAGLSSVVERPERIHASVLGLATAYVRLGGRYEDGPAAPHPKRNSTSLRSIPFKIHKTARRLSLRSPACTAIHGGSWMNELGIMCDAAESKLAMGGRELSRPAESEQMNGALHQQKAKLHEGDLYLCSGSLNALEGALGGVCEGVDAVFGDQGTRRAFVCIRPPGHHCSAEMPSGFCWLNNVHVGIGHAAVTHGLTHAAIIDFDLHHGDGSQTITWAHNSRIMSLPKNTPMSKKMPIGYFSLHDINSYPCEMGEEEKVRNASLCIENAHGQSIWNVHLQPWKTEAEFWALYQDRYLVVLAKARAFLRGHSDRLRQAPTYPKPKAAIFLSAGFDASEWESPHMQRHQVNVPTSFYARFTHDVVTMAEEEGLGVDGRVISVLEGGYSDRALMSGVLSHLSGLTTSLGVSRLSSSSNGLGLEMGRRLGKLDINGQPMQESLASAKSTIETFDPAWWSAPLLEEVEALVNPPPPAAAPKKQRNDVRPTYTSVTQSYTAKIVSPSQSRRSVSGSTASTTQSVSATGRAPSPPPPEVDWATAAHELSKLLVPSDRETRSCKPEDLNAEASRARRDRQSGIGLPSEAMSLDSKRMQLREKRAKHSAAPEDVKEVSSRASRRKTIADVSLLSQESEGSSPMSEIPSADRNRKPIRRRSSAASVSSLSTDKGSDFTMGSIAETQAKQQPLTVKKARASVITRPEAAKPRVAKRPAPASRVPSDSSAVTKVQTAAIPTANRKAFETAPGVVSSNRKDQDVDQLSSNMKQMSLKLNVPPKEEYRARQGKSQTAPKGGSAKPTTARASKAGSPTKRRAKTSSPTKVKTKNDPISGPMSSLPNDVESSPTATQEIPPNEKIVDSDVQQPQPFPQSAEIEAFSADELPITSPPSVSESAHSTRQSPSLPPNILPDPNPSTLPPLPPSSPTVISTPAQPSTPITARRTRQELPVFTSTSSISFGTKPTAPPNGIGYMTIAANSTTEHGTQPLAPMSSNGQITAGARPGSQGAKIETDQPLKAEERDSAMSIWDIPDTPQQRK